MEDAQWMQRRWHWLGVLLAVLWAMSCMSTVSAAATGPGKQQHQQDQPTQLLVYSYYNKSACDGLPVMVSLVRHTASDCERMASTKCLAVDASKAFVAKMAKNSTGSSNPAQAQARELLDLPTQAQLFERRTCVKNQTMQQYFHATFGDSSQYLFMAKYEQERGERFPDCDKTRELASGAIVAVDGQCHYMQVTGGFRAQQDQPVKHVIGFAETNSSAGICLDQSDDPFLLAKMRVAKNQLNTNRVHCCIRGRLFFMGSVG